MIRVILLACVLMCGACASPQAAPAGTPVPREKIGEFQGEFRWLSSFWACPVEFEGIAYPSAEHAYQSAKTLDMGERRRIAALATAAEAKRAGRALAQRADWEAVKFEVMERVVRDKFTRNAGLRARLLATGDAYLEEGNTWNDRVWGVSPPGGEGENRLGKILMSVREEVRVSSARPADEENQSVRPRGGQDKGLHEGLARCARRAPRNGRAPGAGGRHYRCSSK